MHWQQSCACSFQSTPSGGKATRAGCRQVAGDSVSIHAFRGEGDPTFNAPSMTDILFQSTPSGGKATWVSRRSRTSTVAFQSTPSGGKATPSPPALPRHRGFQSTPSGGKATRGHTRIPWDKLFQSTPSGGKATGCSDAVGIRGFLVSIHAFRGEGDTQADYRRILHRSFNPRLPGGRRRASGVPGEMPNIVSIHAFRGEGDRNRVAFEGVYLVSIHAFRGEGDGSPGHAHADMAGFNPRLPGGRRRCSWRVVDALECVSIHAFRGEGDRQHRYRRQIGRVSIHAFRGEGDPPGEWTPPATASFNPRLPGGRRRAGQSSNYFHKPSFNPRLPGGRRQFILLVTFCKYGVSIHAFRGEGDVVARVIAVDDEEVSIHAFRGEGDSGMCCGPSTAMCFNPRLPGGRRPCTAPTLGSSGEFQSTPSGGKATLALPGAPLEMGVSIHAFRGEGDEAAVAVGEAVEVSIHAFRGEGDIGDGRAGR